MSAATKPVPCVPDDARSLDGTNTGQATREAICAWANAELLAETGRVLPSSGAIRVLLDLINRLREL